MGGQHVSDAVVVDAVPAGVLPAGVGPAGGAPAAARRALAAQLAQRIAPVVPAADQRFVVHPALGGLWPDGVARASAIAVGGTAAVSVAALLAAAPTAAGCWVAVAGIRGFGAAAAAETGLVLDRVIRVRGLGDASPETRAAVLSALVDGFDVVVLGAALVDRPAVMRQVVRRAQARRTMLVAVAEPGAGVAQGYGIPPGVDVRLHAEQTWYGLDGGAGVLRARRIDLLLDGRRVGQRRRDAIWCPAPDGRIARVDGADASRPAEELLDTAVDAAGRGSAVIPMGRAGTRHRVR